MNRRNLLPPHRLVALRRRRAVRRWVAVNSAYAVLLAVVGVAYACSAGPDAAVARPAPPADLAALTAKLAGLRQQSAALAATWRSAQEVTGRPDYGVLLAALAGALGDDVVLGGVDCVPAGCTVGGVGRSQAAVTGFVLRVEALALFTRVRLTQTTPQSLRGGDGVGFRLVCDVPEGGR